MLKLIIEDDEGRKTVVPFVRDEITIGRQEGNTIRLTERNVSRHHARLTRSNGHVLIEDLDSFNGIRINGDKIKGQVQIADGDLIQIGDYDLALHADQVATTEGATTPLEMMTTRRLPERPATVPSLPDFAPSESDTEVTSEGKDSPTSARNQSTAVIRMDQVDTGSKREVVNLDLSEAPRLLVLNTELSGREFLCSRSEMRVGRTEENDIAIDHRSLSRTHCKVVRESSGEWRVIDLQSANGLLVNGEPYAQVALQSGDIIELGHVKLKFLLSGEATPSLSAMENGPTSEYRRPSKFPLPVMAIAATATIAVMGIGGYFWLKGETHSVETAPPRPPPKVAVELSPEAVKLEAQRKLEQAKTAAVTLDWANAEALAKDAQKEGSVAPAAAQFLSRLGAERKHAEVLEEASRHLNSGNLDKAKSLLDSAAPTQLFGQNYDALVTKYTTLKAEQATAKQVPAPPPVKVDPRMVEAEKLYKDATEEKKAKNLEKAAARLEKCIKTLPTYHPCYRLAGSVYASIATRDQSAPDMEKARRFYERFLEVAPPDDEYVPKVRAILEQAKNQ